MADLQFVAGSFRAFRATTRFHLGKIQQDVMKDDVVEFDGTTLKLAGASHPLPELRAAIKAGWLSLTGSSVSDYVPQSSNVKVRPAMDKDKGKPVNTDVQQDETFVGSARKASTTDGVKIESKAFNSTVIRDTEGDGRTVGSSTKKPAPTGGDVSEGEAVARIKTSAKRSFSVDGSTSMNADGDSGSDVTGVVEHIKGASPKVTPSDGELTREGQSSETGKVIANVKVAAKRKVTLTDANSADAEISKLDNSTRSALSPKGKRDIAALAGDTLEEIIPANEPENRGRVLAEQAKAKRLAALKAQESEVRVIQEKPLHPVEMDTVAPEEGDLPEAEDSPIPVKVIDAVAPAKVVAKPPKSVEDFAVNGDDLELAPGVRWNKKLHWKTRVNQALQYRNRPEVLNLIRGHEVPSVVKAIDAALAK
jgi:hypothetical protein